VTTTSSRRRRTDVERRWFIALGGALALLLAWPLLRLVQEAVAPNGALDPSVLQRVLQSPATWRAAWRTLETSFWGSLISVVLGTAFALLVTLTNIRGKAAMVFAFMLPLMLPSQITALAWLGMLGPNSVLLQIFGIAPAPGSAHPLLGRTGIILLFGVEHAPFVFLALRAALRGMPRDLVDAARASGARPMRIVLQIILPLGVPAIAAGALLAFVASVGNFGTPALLGIPVNYTTLATLIYQRLAGFGPSVLALVAGLSLVIAGIALIGVVLHAWIARRIDVRIAGAGNALVSWRLGRMGIGVECVAWAFLVGVVIVPMLALLASSLVPAIGVVLSIDTATFAAYAEVLLRQDATRRAFINSFALAITAAILLTAAAIPLARILAWRRGRAAAALDAIVELPYALPGVVLAIAMILVFLRPLPLLGISIYGTLWLILLAYLARFLALALRPVMAQLRQIDPALDEAASSCGAGYGRRLRDILVPMLAPAAAAGAMLVMLTAINELTVSALLWTSGRETLGVIVYSLQEAGDAPLAAAVAIVATILVLLLMAGADRFARYLPNGTMPWRV
jgi:iron(III) transport system permease protein